MLNAENLSVHCDWEGAKETQRLDEAEITFERIWADEEPGLRVLELPDAVKKRLIESWPYSFLLCDEVGLGKTIEAGLALRSLILSGLARRVLIAPPVSLAIQWQNELKQKFLLRFARALSGTHPRHEYIHPVAEQLPAKSVFAPDCVIVQTADYLVNFDLPWNPAKVEQRIGRIDRIGQRHTDIYVQNFCYLGSVEEIVCDRLLNRLGSSTRASSHSAPGFDSQPTASPPSMRCSISLRPGIRHRAFVE